MCILSHHVIPIIINLLVQLLELHNVCKHVLQHMLGILDSGLQVTDMQVYNKYILNFPYPVGCSKQDTHYKIAAAVGHDVIFNFEKRKKKEVNT